MKVRDEALVDEEGFCRDRVGYERGRPDGFLTNRPGDAIQLVGLSSGQYQTIPVWNPCDDGPTSQLIGEEHTCGIMAITCRTHPHIWVNLVGGKARQVIGWQQAQVQPCPSPETFYTQTELYDLQWSQVLDGLVFIGHQAFQESS